MKSKNLILFFISSVFSFIARAQTADEIVIRYIAFIGGVQKWKSVKTITSSGIYNYGGMKFPFVSYSKAPDQYKYVVTLNGKSFMQAYDGQQGWRIDGFKNEKKKTLLKGRQGTAMANEADVELESPFINYHKKGYTVLLEGKDTVNNKTCYKIKLMRENVDTSTFFFDDKNFSMVKKTAISKNTEMDNALMDIYYSDYQVTAGIKTPRKIACLANGQNILIITVKSVKLNLPIENKIFKP